MEGINPEEVLAVSSSGAKNPRMIDQNVLRKIPGDVKVSARLYVSFRVCKIQSVDMHGLCTLCNQPSKKM